MTDVLPFLAWLFTGLLLLVVAVCVAAASGAIPPNAYVGIRFPAIQRDASAWRAGHAAGILPAAVAFAVALICSLIGLAVAAAYTGAIVAFVGGIVWVLVRATRAAIAAS